MATTGDTTSIIITAATITITATIVAIAAVDCMISFR